MSDPTPLPPMVCVGCEVIEALPGGVVCAGCLSGPPSPPMIKSYKFGGCTIIIGADTHGEFCVTRFPDGLELLARPQPHDPQRDTFNDPWTQCWTHEFLHTMMAVATGNPYSQALRFAAEQQIEDYAGFIQRGGSITHHFDLDAIRDEEHAVLNMQRTMTDYSHLINQGYQGALPL